MNSLFGSFNSRFENIFKFSFILTYFKFSFLRTFRIINTLISYIGEVDKKRKQAQIKWELINISPKSLIISTLCN